MNNILAPELTASLTVARDLRVGDLIVFTDYARREIGGTITRIWAAGEVSRLAQVEVKICGLSAPAPYSLGQRLVLEPDTSNVRRAI